MAGKKTQPERRRHIPERTCIACRRKVEKRRLTRIVRTSDAGVIIDPSGKRNGRGAYICDDPQCWANAVERKILDAALKTTLSAAEREAILSARPDHDTVVAS